MPGPRGNRLERSDQRVRAAVTALEAARVSPLTRPRVLAAARALGMRLSLSDWYSAAWELEQTGDYHRRGNGETEWLEPVRVTTTTDG
ncbi:MAG: hypothetical protein ACRDHE_14635, partial [Ktedonobacterales bacterium]